MARPTIRAIVMNLLMLCAIYFGAWQQVEWLGWLVAGFIWFMCAIYFLVLFSDAHLPQSGDPFPFGVMWLVDATATYMLVHADWYVTATVYALSALVLEVICRRTRSADPS